MGTPDETDMTLEDLKARLAQAEPVEIIDSLVTVDPSPWLLGRTSRRYVGRSPVVRHQSTAFDLRVSGAASS
jgi:hypothetical protein